MAKKQKWKPEKFKAAQSGADTPRSGKIVQHGGKVDPDALLKRIQAAHTATADEGDQASAVQIPDDPDRIDAASTSADEDAPNRVVFVLQRDLDKRLDKYLCDRIPFMSRSQLQRLIDEGGVSVNARPPKASTKLHSGDRVEVFVPPPPPSEVQPEDIPIEVLYEDDHLIVLNKAPDIIVHPARSHNSGTLINALAYHFKHRSGGSLSGVGKEFARPGVVHRLDRHTSGLILFAKTDEAHWRLGQQFEKRTVDKRYLALVHGIFEPLVDVIDLPLGPHPSREKGHREKYVVRYDELGKSAITIARARMRFGADDVADADSVDHDQDVSISQTISAEPVETKPGWKSPVTDGRIKSGTASSTLPGGVPRGFSLVELELKTGRTHQIRVHLMSRGFSIVGDDMYGGRYLYTDAKGHPTIDLPPELEANQVVPAKRVLIARQALHATSLRFKHPTENREMSFTAPWPADMARAMESMRRAHLEAEILTPPGAGVNIP
jgi:23S rRNA pseudouridine1911/1915/1917 synthase